MKVRVLAGVCALSAYCLAADVAAPNPGFVRYEGQPLARVLGVPGNLIVVNAGSGGAEAAAFSDGYGLLAAAGVIRLLDRNGEVLDSTRYQGHTPILSIGPDAASALAWVPDEHTLIWRKDHHFVRTSVGDTPRNVRSVSQAPNETALLLGADTNGAVFEISVALADGSTISSTVIPGVRDPAYAFGTYRIWLDEQGLEVQASNGSQYTLVAPGRAFTAEAMSAHWVHLFFTDKGTHWALHLNGKRPSLSMLPVLAHEGAGK